MGGKGGKREGGNKGAREGGREEKQRNFGGKKYCSEASVHSRHKMKSGCLSTAEFIEIQQSHSNQMRNELKARQGMHLLQIWAVIKDFIQ